MAEFGAPISQDWLAVHPDCWCICLCYLHFAPENRGDGKQEVGNSSRMQHNPACRVLLMMTKGLMDCGKAEDFGSVPEMLTN